MSLHRGGTLYIDHGQPTAAGSARRCANLREIAPTYHNMVPAGWMLLADELEQDEALARRFFERVRVLQYGGAALGQAVADRIQAVACARWARRSASPAAMAPPRPARPPATSTGPTTAWA